MSLIYELHLQNEIKMSSNSLIKLRPEEATLAFLTKNQLFKTFNLMNITRDSILFFSLILVKSN
uniref:Bm13308, isoform b n=1 Tax=Brugia malayi TaxID=6279 RepID=A0A1I9G2G3_BRUMA|nr:Bm13308, isoform b [Brugia malayi]